MATSILEFAELCLKNIDYEFLTLFDLTRGEEASCSTYPDEWCERYLSQKYYEHDYTLLKNLYLPVVWNEKTATNMPPTQKKVFQEAQDFQIYQGITIPFSNTNRREFMTLAFHKKDRILNHKLQDVDNELRTIGQIIFSYKQFMENDITEGKEVLQFLEEVAVWQNQCRHNQRKRQLNIDDILHDIKTAELFISHHETKNLGCDLLHRLYKDIEKLL